MKLPHWAAVLVAALGALVAFLTAQNASGAIVLPAVILGVLPTINAVLGILSPSARPAVNLAAARKASPTLFKLGAAALALCFLFAGALACQACSGAQVTQEETLGVDLTVCVLQHETEPPAQIAIDCAAGTLIDVQKVLDAHKAAELRELADGGAK